MKLNIIILALCVCIVAITGTYLFLNKKTDTDPLQTILQRKGKLTIGTDAPFGIMEFFDKDGKIIGVEADIADEIGKAIGIKTEMIDYDFDHLLKAVKNGDVDFALSSITITPEREKEMLFSIPYFNGGQSILTKKENNSIILPDDLKNKKIGVQKETTGATEAKKYTSEKNISVFDSYENQNHEKSGVIYELKTGKIDAMLLDYIASISLVKDNPEIKITGEPITQEYYGIATKLDNDLLMGKINSTLRDLQSSGKLQEIINKWK